MRSCLTLMTMMVYVCTLFLLIPLGRVSMAFVLLFMLLSDHGKPYFPGFDSVVVWSYLLSVVLVLAASALLVLLQRDRQAAPAGIARIDAIALVFGLMLLALGYVMTHMFT